MYENVAATNFAEQNPLGSVIEEAWVVPSHKTGAP